MSAAREVILARIRAATGPAAAPADVDAAYAALPRGYLRAHHDPAATDIVSLFAERAADYRATVERVSAAGVADAIARAVTALPRIVVPDGLPPAWLAALPRPDAIVRDDPPLSARDLDLIAGVVTGCAAAIAETGTIILDHGPGQGRRALTLVPDFHLRSLGHERHRTDPRRRRTRPPATCTSSSRSRDRELPGARRARSARSPASPCWPPCSR
jgi:L-lactate dehydrogenase complex protein LldG